MRMPGVNLENEVIKLDADLGLDFLSPLKDRGSFLYDIWHAETKADVARNPVEQHLLGEAINNALFEETGEYSDILKRCEMDRGSALPDLMKQFGEEVKRKLKYLLEVYLLEVRDNRLCVTPFYRHLIALRHKLADVQVLF